MPAGSRVAIETLFTPVGSHNDGLDISSAATIAIASGATRLLIQALGQNARFTLDGTVPTATKGFQLKSGDPPVLIPVRAGITTFKIIEEAATCDLQYQFGS